MPTKKAKRYRGPSRPVDPRYAPGPAVRQQRDTFGVWLIAISAVAVLAIILWATLLNGNNNTTPTSTTTTTTTSGDMSAQATAQMHTVETQVVIDATETAGLPRIEASEALNLYNAGSITIVDVRASDNYLVGHIKGATSIPESDVSKRLAEIPKLGNLVVYCQ
jgi:hypothetical protein